MSMCTFKKKKKQSEVAFPSWQSERVGANPTLYPSSTIRFPHILRPETARSSRRPCDLGDEAAGGVEGKILIECAGKYQGIKTIYLHWESAPVLSWDFDADLIQYLPDSVKYICKIGVGYDSIDVDECTKRGIYVSNTLGEFERKILELSMLMIESRSIGSRLLHRMNNRYQCFPNSGSPRTSIRWATADINVLLILAACRNAYQFMSSLRAARYLLESPKETGSTAVFATGSIPKARHWAYWGWDGLAGEHISLLFAITSGRRGANAWVPLEQRYNAAYVDFPTFLWTSDIISINVPLTRDTHRLIGARELEMMRDGVVRPCSVDGQVCHARARA
ncbi:hypothetical protein BC936DRAFT_148940 [Jimgerdemannia flammicorona]|uniref:D-isomer specific 2-hydroxyacid dehydrogenase catalytic domain-containing protein n=1 Tax=Jimgerdemannia flammicorona TaxID=994334 RepID=A0A433D1Y8_9FUNG|nr:hypothetical protein BC936DRAFT_148940 [Jimgerdemannia flammicorona]